MTTTTTAPGAAPPAAAEALLDVRDLRIRDDLTGAEVVRGVSFALPPGGVVGVVGESGSGKTLTCRALLGVLPERFSRSGGEVRLAGRNTADLTRAEWTALRGSAISGVFAASRARASSWL